MTVLEEEPDSFVAESISASMTADRAYGPPGYRTEITAFCKATGTQAGIEQFYVRASDTNDLNFSVTHPEEDSVGVVMSLEVMRRYDVSMRCAGRAGDHIDKQLILNGYQPVIHRDSIPSLSMQEDDVLEVDLPAGFIQYADRVSVYPSAAGVSLQMTGWPEHPNWRITSHSDAHGPFTLLIQAFNTFGMVEERIPLPVEGITDLFYDLRVAGSIAPASTQVRWLNADGQELGRRDHPPYMLGVQLEEASGGEITVEAGFDRQVFFPIRTTMDTSDGRDVVWLATLHPVQYCRQVFASEASPLAACRDLASETLFTDDDGHGYHPYPVLPAVRILESNPETGQTFSADWIEAFQRLASTLEQWDVPLLLETTPGSISWERLPDGQLEFEAGSWLYPGTEAEPVGMMHRLIQPGQPSDNPKVPDLSGLVRSASMAADVQSSPPDDDQLLAMILSLGYGIRPGSRWDALPSEVQIAFLREVVARFRFDDRTAWSVPDGALIDDVLGVLE